MKIISVGLCQAKIMSDLMALHFAGASSQHVPVAALTANAQIDVIRQADIVYVQSAFRRRFSAYADMHSLTNIYIRYLPTIFFNGYHPDFSYLNGLRGPTGRAVSTIASYAFLTGASERQAVELFNKSTYERLNYFEYFEIANNELVKDCNAVGVDIEPALSNWTRGAPFVFTPNHPSREALSDIVLARAALDGVALGPNRDLTRINDYRGLGSWPLYPEIAEARNLSGEMVFKRKARLEDGALGLERLDLKAYVELFYEANDGVDKDGVLSSLKINPAHARGLEVIGSIFRAPTRSSHARSPFNPFAGLPAHHFWRKSVAGRPIADVDPMIGVKFPLARGTKIATAGSCFAQHVARHLKAKGYNYFVAEPGRDIPEASRAERNFGVYSARYGNVYTARQLLQLFDRSEGEFDPVDQVWRKDDRFIDPFRPEIEPGGFATPGDALDARERHFRDVRRMWRELDVFVFTLGLTEAWRSKRDGSVFPVAPGIVSDQMEPDDYEFHNFSAHEVTQDLIRFTERLKRVNPGARIVLTVSPVPLVATYEKRHVLVATTYSKSVLRVAAEEATGASEDVDYFPSYEIITGFFNRGRYFEEDLRSVTEEGVGHVMRVFLKAFDRDAAASPAPSGETLPGAAPDLIPAPNDDWRSSLATVLEDSRRVACEEELNDVD